MKKISNSLYKATKEDSSLSKELENLDFYHLMNIANKLSDSEKQELFGDTEYLEENLLAVKELRNTVSHHRMLFVYEDFYPCYKCDGTYSDTLFENIINLRNLLNSYYKNYFTDAINKCVEDKKRKDFKVLLPESSIISI